MNGATGSYIYMYELQHSGKQERGRSLPLPFESFGVSGMSTAVHKTKTNTSHIALERRTHKDLLSLQKNLRGTNILQLDGVVNNIRLSMVIYVDRHFVNHVTTTNGPDLKVQFLKRV